MLYNYLFCHTRCKPLSTVLTSWRRSWACCARFSAKSLDSFSCSHSLSTRVARSFSAANISSAWRWSWTADDNWRHKHIVCPNLPTDKKEQNVDWGVSQKDQWGLSWGTKALCETLCKPLWELWFCECLCKVPYELMCDILREVLWEPLFCERLCEVLC